MDDPHARESEVITWTTADPDDRPRLYKVDSAQGAVTRLQATEKRSIHGVDIVAVEVWDACCVAPVIVLSA
jgi:hypothetical protein